MASNSTKTVLVAGGAGCELLLPPGKLSPGALFVSHALCGASRIVVLSIQEEVVGTSATEPVFQRVFQRKKAKRSNERRRNQMLILLSCERERRMTPSCNRITQGRCVVAAECLLFLFSADLAPCVVYGNPLRLGCGAEQIRRYMLSRGNRRLFMILRYIHLQDIVHLLGFLDGVVCGRSSSVGAEWSESRTLPTSG